jgi:hypothetical protein
VDAYGAEAAGGFVQCQRREVEEAADLVLGLHVVSEVLARRDWAIGAGHTILPRVLAVLQTVPAKLVKIVANQLTNIHLDSNSVFF